MLAPGGCYSQCGVGLTMLARKETADMYECTSESQLVKFDEAIAESERAQSAPSAPSAQKSVGGRAHTSAMVLAAALVALAIAA